MDAAQAISLVSDRIRSHGLDYPVAELIADPFWACWCVYAPVMVTDPAPDEDEPVTRSVFLVSPGGRVEEVSSTEPARDARSHFEEACLWFAASEPPVAGADRFAGPTQPDFGRHVRPRPPRRPAAHDFRAVEAFTLALAHERDFPRWLVDRLREAGDLLGGVGHLVARRPDTWAAEHLVELVETDEDGSGGVPTAVWRDWPPVDPASLPDVDPEGWLLVPGEVVCEYLEPLDAGSDAAARLADTLDDLVRRAPRWRSCGVAELLPSFVPLRRDARVDADVEELRRLAAEEPADDRFGALFAAPSPDDPDVRALLRLAIDAEQRGRDVVDVDAAGTAAYRRVLDRLGLVSEHDWFGVVFEADEDDPYPRRATAPTPDPTPDGAVVTSARDAIASVVEWVRARGLDYPTEGLVADRFEAGWSVYAPVEVDESDPMAFLDLPVGRSVFLVGDSGRIKETSGSVPPRQAEEQFIAEERAADDLFDLEWAAVRLKEEGAIQDFTIVDTPPDEVIAASASRLIEPIVQQLALVGPAGWRRFGAVFTCTVSAAAGRVRFWTDQPNEVVAVPEPIMALVRRQREVAARMPAGPWWRLLLTVTHHGETTVEYDYGDRPLPPEDLLPAAHYRDDLAAYPRAHVPSWLADHVATADGPGTTLDTAFGSRRLRADSREITYGDRSLPLDRIDWVRYHDTHTTTKRFLGRSSHEGIWYFSLGRYPATSTDTIELEFTTEGRDAPPPDAWAFLVDLARRELEPRLVARFADRVRRGETVDVAGLSVGREGVTSGRTSLPWPAVGDVRRVDGRLGIFRPGEPEPAIQVPLSNVNAVLLPALLAAVRR
ncbi:hypothetical protein [Saccharothrix sp. S26]|uniref:hypothetical protein n=1 Tax=Saccharothrix sp. S26 TaxID=2907215 RepID=UPI001F2103A7|nr:hypothetical protein [Saccharothrix sp. S26]